MPKYCKDDNCNTTPYYGLITDKQATYCVTHKLDNMIDIRSPKCIFDTCNKTPYFGLATDKKATYCFDHKSDNMIDIKSPKCIFDTCISRALYNFSIHKNPIYCFDHKLEDMINISSKKCNFGNCTKNTTFGLVTDKSPTYCYDHKSDNMINISSKKCITDNCINRALFGLSTDKSPTYCYDHKSDNMIDINSKKCDLCKLTTMNRIYKPNCARCHFYLNPNDPRIRNYKTKEQGYMSALLEKFPQFKLDKTIDGGCSKRRPDGFLDLLTHVIIIEIDENEHKSYDDTCNNRRTMELSQDVNHRPIIFIRLNPDSYKLNGIRIKGSFSLTKKTGELKVVKKEFNKRLDSLINSVENYMNTIPDKIISVEYLYFSDHY